MRRFVINTADIRTSGRSWIAAMSSQPNTAQNLIRRTTFWVFDPDKGQFFPSKWVGYQGMTPARYEDALSGQEGGAPFQGTQTRLAIENATGNAFSKNDHLKRTFESWATGIFATVLGGIDQEKWRFLTLAPADEQKSSNGVSGGSRGFSGNSDMSVGDPFWGSYTESWDFYERVWSTYNDVLYEMCEKRLSHESLPDVVAKVGIVARAYAAGLERHGDPEGPGAIVAVAELLHREAPKVDGLIKRLRQIAGSSASLDSEHLREVVDIHGIFGELASSTTRNGNSVRSWCSKYLHFHAPGVPIFDSRARMMLEARYDLRRASNNHFDCPRNGDYEYCKFANRFLSLWEEAARRHLRVSVRRLDQHLLWLADRQDGLRRGEFPTASRGYR